MRHALGLATALLFTLLVFAGTDARAASFPCARAATCTEHVICQTPQLSRMDEQMAQLYFLLQSQVADRASLQRSQGIWLSRRDGCGCNANCLMGAYEERIQQLENALGR